MRNELCRIDELCHLAELQTRPCQLLAELLRRADLWPLDDDYARTHTDQRRRGRRLADHVLSGHATPPITIGRQVPFVLAFGYDIAAILCRLRGVDREVERIAGLGAVFNHGISLFDLIVDNKPELLPVLLARCDEARLQRMLADPRSVAELAGSSTSPILELLLAAMAAFFRGMHAIDAAPKARERLEQLILQAFRAEITSSSEGDGRATSTLPFAILDALAGLAGGDDQTGQRFAEPLGIAFWLIDDLADLWADCRSGHANTLIAQASGGQHWPPGDPDDEVSCRLLCGGMVEDAAVVAVQHLRTAVDLIQPADVASILTYARTAAS